VLFRSTGAVRTPWLAAASPRRCGASCDKVALAIASCDWHWRGSDTVARRRFASAVRRFLRQGRARDRELRLALARFGHRGSPPLRLGGAALPATRSRSRSRVATGTGAVRTPWLAAASPRRCGASCDKVALAIARFGWITVSLRRRCDGWHAT